MKMKRKSVKYRAKTNSSQLRQYHQVQKKLITIQQENMNNIKKYKN